jgi:hypothetical protein
LIDKLLPAPDSPVTIKNFISFSSPTNLLY